MGRSGHRGNKEARALRIIGGIWRGRRLTFADIPGLRPTPDRVRETLFNWLQPNIEGSVCLDLFAGSGALGFEAASRGAAQVVMVDANLRAVRHLQHQTELLQAAQISVVRSDAFEWLQSNDLIFDNVFLDPPFDEGFLKEAIHLLRQSRTVATGARVYMETEAGLSAPELPDGWQCLHSKRAGRVRFHLAIVGSI